MREWHPHPAPPLHPGRVQPEQDGAKPELLEEVGPWHRRPARRLLGLPAERRPNELQLGRPSVKLLQPELHPRVVQQQQSKPLPTLVGVAGQLVELLQPLP